MGSDRREGERFSHEFIQSLIESGLAFARIAATAYAHGERVYGDAIAAKAEQASAEVSCWLHDAEAHGWEMADVRQRSRALHTALATLRSRAQKAA